MPGDETRKITTRLEDVIRGMAGQVGEIHGWRGSVDRRLDGVEKGLGTQNGRIDDLESSRDKSIGMGTVLGWVGGFLIGLPSLTYGVIKVVEWLKP